MLWQNNTVVYTPKKACSIKISYFYNINLYTRVYLNGKTDPLSYLFHSIE